MRFATRALALLLLAAVLLIPPAAASPVSVGILTVNGPITPVSARYLARGIDKAAVDRVRLAVIKLDTPGGLLSSTRDMVESILSAKIPVAVYVSPPGARAASAGTFITAAANFAVMAPGTNIGAASPVAAGGDLPKTMAKKINEDTAAFIRSIAEKRSRNAQALEATVTRALSYSAREAVQKKVVDFIARDLGDLLAQLDGRTAETASGSVVLSTKDASFQEIEQTALEGFLDVIANPNLAFLLLTIGGVGLLVEFLTPGFIGPGVIGGIALGLAVLGMGHLPVNWVGVALILFAMVLFYLEVQVAGIGIFGIGGVICFVLGAFLLFGDILRTPDIPEPSFQVRLWVIGVTTGSLVVSLGSFLYFVVAAGGSETGYISRSQKVLVGQEGVAVSDLAPSGKINVGDVEWTATSDTGDLIRQGEGVRVVGIYGDVLKVSSHSQEAGREDGQ
jgi:membrane-bound serine protease (ClpP class)